MCGLTFELSGRHRAAARSEQCTSERSAAGRWRSALERRVSPHFESEGTDLAERSDFLHNGLHCRERPAATGLRRHRPEQ
jgi:hypothetical protein